MKKLLLLALLYPLAAFAQPFTLYQLWPYGDDAAGNQIGFESVDHSFTITDQNAISFWSTMDEESGKDAVVAKIDKGFIELGRMFQSADGEILVIGVGGERPRMEAYALRSGEKLAEFPETQLALVDDQATLSGPLSARLTSALKKAVNAPEWWRAAWSYHRSMIQNWRESVRTTDANLAPMAPADIKDLPAVQALLAGPFQPVSNKGLAGNWSCRSMQVEPLGVYAYPNFKCAITGSGSKLEFTKLTGSQRKNGRLYADANPLELVFLGGSSVNDDPKGEYSRASSPEPLDSDAYGVLLQRAPNHLVMVFNTDGTSYEVFELKR
jgi:hypothetical protein